MLVIVFLKPSANIPHEFVLTKTKPVNETRIWLPRLPDFFQSIASYHVATVPYNPQYPSPTVPPEVYRTLILSLSFPVTVIPPTVPPGPLDGVTDARDDVEDEEEEREMDDGGVGRTAGSENYRLIHGYRIAPYLTYYF